MQPDDDNRPIDAARPSGLAGVTERGADPTRAFMLVAAAGFLVARIPTLPHRAFDPDEFEHAHAAWCVFKGMIPYKDFFEHHTPWYYYALRPFFHWFDVAGSFDSARHFLLFGRGLSLALTVVSALLVLRLARVWRDRRVGALAALLFVEQPVVLQKTLEIRPDMLALPLFLASLLYLTRGLASTPAPTARRLAPFAASGLALGAAVMCTQKQLFVLPGLLVGLAAWALTAGAAERRVRVGSILVLLLGVVTPGVVTWAAFAARGAGDAFIANNFLLNARWKHIETHQLMKLIETSAPVLVLALLGAGGAVTRWLVAREARDDGEAVLCCTLVGLFAGVVVIPTAQRQYYLMPLPLCCLFAARGLLWLVDRAPPRARGKALVASLILLSVLPAVGVWGSFTDRNDAQLARLRRVFQTTKPTDVVMDGWEGMGVFRPHAFYYFFIHDESLLMLPADSVNTYVDALARGAIRPKLIALDNHLVALGPRFMRLVTDRYVTRDGFLYYAKD